VSKGRTAAAARASVASSIKVDAFTLVQQASRLISREEAEFLLMEITGWKRHEIYTHSRQISKFQVLRFWWMVDKVRTGTPVQYLVNSAPFLDVNLYVDERVFIPRPETEELVLRTGTRVKSPRFILDYGTGSGCIAITLARMFPQAEIWAVDISRPALAVAKRNLGRYQLKDRVRTICLSSLYSNRIDFLEGKLDVLISNPPYIPRERLASIDSKVRDYEPGVSVDGGIGGTAVVGMLLKYGPRFLKPGGLLALEIDHTQESFVRTLVPTAVIEKDFAGYVRYVFWQNLGGDNGK